MIINVDKKNNTFYTAVPETTEEIYIEQKCMKETKWCFRVFLGPKIIKNIFQLDFKRVWKSFFTEFAES